ncbi:S-layer homology domain-containing protein [Paenibacillus oryzisoli]|uniref:S-layer homology domain-containing protein n=1 Tax=Paenibacillus oryzisoli TaxID=1850517 RepID=UPI003D2B92FC
MTTRFMQKLSIVVVMVMFLQLLSSLLLEIPHTQAASYRYDPNTGKYLESVPLPGADFNELSPSDDNIHIKSDPLLNFGADDTSAPVNKLIVTSGGISDASGVIDVAQAVYESGQSYDGTGYLQFGKVNATGGGPINVIYKVDGLDKNATYRLSAVMRSGGGGAFQFGVKSFDALNYTTGSSQMLKSADMGLSTAEWKEISLEFTPTQAIDPHVKIAFWANAGSTTKPLVYVDHIRLEKVLDTEPPAPTPTPTPGQEANPNAVMSVDFENVTEAVYTDPAKTDGFISTDGNAEITNADKKSGVYSLKLGKSSSLPATVRYVKTGLQPSTAYRIVFSAKVANTSNKLSFRISGYRNNNPNDRQDIMNYIEHTQIQNSDWSTFHYDFETGAGIDRAYIEFNTAAGSTAFIDDVSMEIRGTGDVPLTASKLSRGSELFIKQGLQIQSWTATDEAYALKSWQKYPSGAAIKDLGLTAVQYHDAPEYNSEIHKEVPDLKWGIAFGPYASHLSSSYFESDAIKKFDSGKVGSPTQDEQDNGFLTAEQLANKDNLVNVGFGDEENYSDTLTQIIKDWFDVSKKQYPDVLVHHNEVGNTPTPEMSMISTFNEDMLRKYVRTAKPDFITYDMYYWRESRQSQEVGGTVIPFYDDLNRYRKIAAEGYDGSGKSPIPFGKYMQAWRTGPGAATPEKRGDGWYEMTESQINLEAFSNWTFGAKWLSMFAWLDQNPAYIFNDYRMDENGNINKYYTFDLYKEMVRQSKNLGEHLIRINSTDVRIVPGQHLSNGTAVSNARPAGNPAWSKAGDQAFIDSIDVKNIGVANNGLNGDVFIGYFDPLPGIDTTQFFTSTAPKYFMILNGLTSGEGLPAEEQKGSSNETRQQIKVTFDLSSGIDPGKLRKVSRLNGEIVKVPLTDRGNGKYEMTLEIGGGMADLYFWELGTMNAANSYQAGVEDAQDVRLTGDPQYAKKPARDLNGKTVTIGWIQGTTSPVPQPYNNIGFAYTKDASGNLNPMKAGDIGAYFSRDYELELWNRRVARIQKDNHVTLKFVPDLNWTKEQLMTNIAKVKSGETVADMPDILVVPDEWTWSGLVKANMIVPASSFEEFDFTERKWNKAYMAMSSLSNNIYGMYAGPTLSSTGMFANKTALAAVGAADDLAALQQNNGWNWSKLKEIGEKLKNAGQSGKYLLADTDGLFRQMLASNEADLVNLNKAVNGDVQINNANFMDAVELYHYLYQDGLIAEKPEGATDDWYLEQFRKGNLLFMVMPYNQTVERLQIADKTQEATVTMQDGTFLGQPAKVPVITDVRDIAIPAGDYTMSKESWVDLMFPMGPKATGYTSIIDQPSYPVMLASAQDPSDAAYVWNELNAEFTGVAYNRFLKTYLNQRTADLNTLQRIGLKEGVADTATASGVWQAAIKPRLLPALKDGTVNSQLVNEVNLFATAYLQEHAVNTAETSTPETPPSPSTPTTVPAQVSVDANNVPVDANGTASVKIGEDVLQQALQNMHNQTLEIVVKTTGIAKEVLVALPAQQLRAIVEHGVSTVRIHTGLATVSLSSELLNTHMGSMSSSIQLVVSKIDVGVLSEDLQRKIGGNTILDFQLSLDDKRISTFNDSRSVAVSVPYTLTKGEVPERIVAYYVNDEGKLEVVKNGVYHAATGQVAFSPSHFSKYVVMPVAASFNDLDSVPWAKAAIEGLAAREVISGVSEGEFRPDDIVTRAQFIHMLMNGFSLSNEHTNTNAAFNDVQADSWYSASIGRALQLGIVQGKADGSFGVNEAISRQDMAVLVYRMAKFLNLTLKSSTDAALFADRAQIADYAIEAVALLQQNGVLNGVKEGTFAPTAVSTRAQAAVIVSRVLAMMNP